MITAAIVGILWALNDCLEYWLPRTDRVKANSKWEAIANLVYAVTGWRWARNRGTQAPGTLSSELPFSERPTTQTRLPLLLLAALALGNASCAGPIETARKYDDALALSARVCYKTVTAGKRAATARVNQLVADGLAKQAVKDGEAWQGRLAMYEAGCRRGDDLAFKLDDKITEAEKRADKEGARVLIPILTTAAFELADNVAKLQAFIAEVGHDGK